LIGFGANGTLPDDIAEKAQATCEAVRVRVQSGAEPVGAGWLSRFVRESSGGPGHGLGDL
jgi:hypothetical protein